MPLAGVGGGGGGGGGGGYSPPVTREQFTGFDVSVANSTFGALTWDTITTGDALLDITAPGSPTIITAGVYAVAVQVTPDEQLSAGGYFTVYLAMDTAGENAVIRTDSPPATASNSQPSVAVSLMYYCPAGATLDLEVGNHDGVSTRNFVLFAAVVQRVS